MRFAGAAAVAALDRGFGLMLVRDPTSGHVPGIALAVDGFIISDPVGNDPVIRLLKRNGIPLVTVGRDVERPDFTDWIGTGTGADATGVFAHLLERGAQRVALVAGTDVNAWNVDSEAAYRLWCAGRGQDAIVYREDERSGESGGRIVADAMLNSGVPMPDGIYCLTGRHASGLQARLTEAGLTVPGDVMIVAGSDSEQTRNSRPAITSVDLSPEATATAAVNFLLCRLDGDAQSGPPSVQNVLRARESTDRSLAGL